MVGSPVVLALFLFYVGVAATLPLIAGLLGFSQRIIYLYVAALTCAMAGLETVTFSDGLKYQSIFRLLLVDLLGLGLLALELLFAFVLAYWFGDRLRAGFLWIKNRLAKSYS